MKNEFVSYKMALALKELGFDEPCLECYNIYGKRWEMRLNKQSTIEGACLAPTFSQAFKFFREKYKLPSLFLCKDAVLSSFACGRSSAIVLDTGFTKTTATPVHDGYALQKCTLRHSIGGETITDKLEQWLKT